MATLIDPFGHIWLVATRVETLTQHEIEARRQAFFSRS
jgi:hypothetical protein